MKALPPILAAICLTTMAALQASPEEANRIEKTWKLEVEQWSLETRLATTPEQRAKALKSQPDLADYSRRMWRVIGPALNQSWTLPHAAWFMRATPALVSTDKDGSTQPMFARENDLILSTIEKHHLDSPDLTPVCLALAAIPNPRSLSILEKIQAKHPDKKIQGVAALGAAIILKSFGDDAALIRKRLTYLRKAITESFDVDLGGTTVAKLAEDELYIIRFLTKGRVAPNLTGKDSAGRPLSLSEHRDKVVILLFWNSTMPEADRVIEITREIEGKFANRPLSIIGVNNDPLEKLRSLEADGTVTWKNFSDPDQKLAREFRVAARPLVLVLDRSQKIQYTGTPGSFVELTADALLAEEKPVAKPR